MITAAGSWKVVFTDLTAGALDPSPAGAEIGFDVGDTSAFGKASENGDVGELLEGDIAAASDWETCVNAIFYPSLVPGRASTRPRIRARVLMLSCEQSLLPVWLRRSVSEALAALLVHVTRNNIRCGV